MDKKKGPVYFYDRYGRRGRARVRYREQQR